MGNEYQVSFNLDSRESYLESVAQWKTNWHKLVADIRLAKVQVKTAQRALLGTNGYQELISALRRRYQLRVIAREMLEDRKWAKIYSWEAKQNQLVGV